MSVVRPFVCAALSVLAIGLPGATGAVAYDDKAISAALCQPYAPDTTAAELQFTQTGIYNPGTTIEKVMCAMPRDHESYYNEGASAIVAVYYRVLGAAPGRLTCTLFVGSSSMHSQAVTTATGSGPLVSGGNRAAVSFNAPAQLSTFALVPNTLICAISPKTSMGGMFIEEIGETDSPDA